MLETSVSGKGEMRGPPPCKKKGPGRDIRPGQAPIGQTSTRVGVGYVT